MGQTVVACMSEVSEVLPSRVVVLQAHCGCVMSACKWSVGEVSVLLFGRNAAVVLGKYGQDRSVLEISVSEDLKKFCVGSKDD